MNEKFISYLWRFNLLRPPLLTTDAEPIQVLSPGLLNRDSGPDFFNSRIRIGSTLWAGNVEIHVRSSDWERHRHQHDAAYDNIVLHVVYDDDVPLKTASGNLVPTLVIRERYDERLFSTYQSFMENMEPVPCGSQLPKVEPLLLLRWYDRLAAERLEQKVDSLNERLIKTGQDFSTAWYQQLVRNFGFRTNADAMDILSKSLSLHIILKYTGDPFQLEALLFGQAGLLKRKFRDEYPDKLKSEYHFLAGKHGLRPMDPRAWRFMRMRPANFPTLRLSQLAALFHKAGGLPGEALLKGPYHHMRSLLNLSASSYWDTHYQLDGETVALRKKLLGNTSVDLLVINTMLPFRFLLFRHHGHHDADQQTLEWLSRMSPENNAVTRHFLSLGLKAGNALETQAMLQLRKAYCDSKRCLDCHIGHRLLNMKPSQ